MFSYLKAVALVIFLALLVSLFIGSGGSSGGLLNVHRVEVLDYNLYWSWPLFVIGTALAWGLFALMD